jgi:hypothetical protein
MSIQYLTIEQAKEQGYKYAVRELHDDGIVKLDDCKKGFGYILCAKEPTPFTIGDDVVKELVDDYLCNQDEVMDEDGLLNEIASKVDYSAITKKLNKAFSKTKYYYATDIRLIV